MCLEAIAEKKTKSTEKRKMKIRIPIPLSLPLWVHSVSLSVGDRIFIKVNEYFAAGSSPPVSIPVSFTGGILFVS